jgi:hypothetical protein
MLFLSNCLVSWLSVVSGIAAAGVIAVVAAGVGLS